MDAEEKSQQNEQIWRGLQNADDAVKRNAAIVERVVNEVWNAGVFDVCEESFSKNYIGRLSGNMTVRGVEEYKDFVKTTQSAFPDIRYTMEDVIAVGDKVVVRWILRGTHQDALMGVPATQNKVEVAGISIFRIEAEQIMESWDIFDTIEMMRQIGALLLSP